MIWIIQAWNKYLTGNIPNLSFLLDFWTFSSNFEKQRDKPSNDK